MKNLPIKSERNRRYSTKSDTKLIYPQVIYQTPNFTVTSSNLYIDGRSFPINSIGSVRSTMHNNLRLLLPSAFSGWIAYETQTWQLLLVTIICIIIALWPKYYVLITNNAGEQIAIKAKQRAIAEIKEAIDQAIEFRG